METLEIKTITALETQRMIQFVKETFLAGLKEELHLHQVFAPLYVRADSGINDDLNGIEKPVSFTIKDTDRECTVVQSLAKWKRLRLAELDVPVHEGIVTNMMALRPDEKISSIHSVLVDQWDWEIHIDNEDRCLRFLQETVRKIYRQIKITELELSCKYGFIEPVLPTEITFVHSEDLPAMYPGKTPGEREDLITKRFGAVFITGIGNALADGKPHDGRAPDYDDWTTPTSEKHTGLNGDIIVWHPVLGRALELSSMGLRVDREALLRQLELTGTTGRKELYFHKALLEDRLPLSIGGGIGQSRLAMFMLRKTNIKEVQ
ncbi:MAG: aspartate--ammonia ligase [Bacteroidetes bacterium]|nr:aspartate--ammonia ligase [Bacteroidota bacterium]